MSRHIRPHIPGASVFFTVALTDSGAQTLVRHVEVLRGAVRVTKAKRPFVIDAWVVLRDHFHTEWTLPKGDSDYSSRMAEIKSHFTRNLRRSGTAPTRDALTDPARSPSGVVGGRGRGATRVGAGPDLHKNEAPVWQKRFWEHHIRNEAAFAACVRYCWINPVKHELVGHPGEWPYSSWHRDGGADAGV
jgi:putative transposase